MALDKIIKHVNIRTAGILTVLSLMVIFLLPVTVSAQSSTAQSADGACAQQGVQILPSWYKYIEKKTVDGQCELQFDFPDDIGAVLLAIVEIMLRIAGIVAVGYVIYGGFMYMTSQGEPDKAKGAQQTIMNALIGLALALLATGLVAFIGGRLIS